MRSFYFIQIIIILQLSFSAKATAAGDKEISKLLNNYADQAEFYLGRNLDSTLYFIEKIEEGLIEHNLEGSIPIFSALGYVYSTIGKKETALEYYLKGKKLNDKALNNDPSNSDLILQRTGILVDIGNLYFTLKNTTESLANYESALAEIMKIEGVVSEINLAKQKVGIYNNIASIYILNKDYDSALTYFQNALKINETLQSKVYESSITNNIGICYMEKGQYDLADHYLLKSLSARKEIGDKSGEAQAMNNLAKIQLKKGNLDKSLDLYTEALSIAQSVRNINSTLVSLESLSALYDTLGNYKQAYTMHTKLKALSDSIFDQATVANLAAMEQEYLRLKEEEIAQIEKDKAKAELQRTEIRNYAILGGLFFLLIIAILIIFLLKNKIARSKLQHEKLRLENKNHDLETKALQEALDFKERELTTNALFLLQNNELISNIIDKLFEAKSTFKVENQKIIQDIIVKLSASRNQNIWEEFETHFIQVHSDFYKKLEEKFPNLTSNELKLCAFLRLNMSTKEISAITLQSINSITVARSRLRKKLDIDGEDTHLVNFLLKI